MGFFDRYCSNCKENFKVAIPLVLGSLTSVLNTFSDMLIISNVGVSALAGVALAGALFLILSEIINGFGIGYWIRVTPLMGGKETYKLKRLIISAFFTLFVIAILCFTACFIFKGLILGKVGNSLESIYYANHYLKWRLFELLLVPFFIISKILLDADKYTKYGLNAALISFCINIPLSILLTYGFGPLPAFGVSGNAIASVIAMAVGSIYLVYSAFEKHYFKISGIDIFKVDFFEIKSLIKISFPEVCGFGFAYIGNFVFLALVAEHGDATICSFRIVSIMLTILFVISSRFSGGTQILIGREIGSGNSRKIKNIYFQGLLLNITIMCFISVILFFNVNNYVYLLSPSEEVRSLLKQGLILLIWVSPFMALSNVQSSFLRAIGKTKSNFFLVSIPFWLFQMPIGYLIANSLHKGLIGFCIAVLCYHVMRAFIGVVYVRGKIQAVSI